MQPNEIKSALHRKLAIEVEQCSGFKNPKTGETEYPCSAARSEADRILALVAREFQELADCCEDCSVKYRAAIAYLRDEL